MQKQHLKRNTELKKQSEFGVDLNNNIHLCAFLPSIFEIKLTAVKFKIISITFDEFTTNTNELKIAIPPCMKRRRQDKITRRVLSSLVAVSNRGNVSTAVQKDIEEKEH